MTLFTGTSAGETISGTSGDDVIRGLGGDDILFGLAGADKLFGGDGHDVLNAGDGNDQLDGEAGADTMRGGLGDDIYYIDDSGDLAVENAGEGIDTVFSSITYRLRENVENLNLIGSAVRGLGNTLDNRIVGNGGNNILDGLVGADTMRGGLGDDSYYVDNIGDRPIENASEGSDTVFTTISLTLRDNIENMNLIGSAAINATGNALDNRLVGNGADNLLDGGAGADTMRGGAGHDSYFIDNAGDRAIENAGEGSDTVYSAIDFTLGANVENLTLTATAISGTGNGLDNFITGNANDNILSGGGGNDVIDGGTGNDTVEGGDGNDTLRGRAGDDTLHGADGNDYLTGGTGDDILDALGGDDLIVGGSGADMLSGWLGSDTFRYVSYLDSTPNSPDFITDFEAGVDSLDLSRIDANTTIDGNQAFNWSPGPSGAGSLWQVAEEDGFFSFYGDVDGDNVADFYVHFHGSFNSDDIVL